MDQLLIGLAVASWIFLSVSLYFYVRFRTEKQRLAVHLARLKMGDMPRDKKPNPFWGTVRLAPWQERLYSLADRLSPFGRHLLFPDREEELKLWMERAGVGSQINAERFLGMKAVLAAAGFLLGIGGHLIGLPFFDMAVVLLPLSGFFAPVFWIRRKAGNRQEQISRDMPDFLDMMSLALQAGATPDYALRRIPHMFSGPLKEEMLRLNHELDLGAEYAEAWRRMLERNRSPELQKVANSILQARRLGVSVAAVIRLQGDDMRRMRLDRAKERAAKASPKITLVTTVLMAPSVFIVIAGLLVLNIFYNSGGLGIDMLFR